MELTPFTPDAIDGIGAEGFSLETAYGKTFKVIYRLFSNEEAANLEDVVMNTYRPIVIFRITQWVNYRDQKKK